MLGHRLMMMRRMMVGVEMILRITTMMVSMDRMVMTMMMTIAMTMTMMMMMMMRVRLGKCYKVSGYSKPVTESFLKGCR
jgi:hypothetical protein